MLDVSFVINVAVNLAKGPLKKKAFRAHTQENALIMSYANNPLFVYESEIIILDKQLCTRVQLQ